MTSGFCKQHEHAGCSPHGRMLSTSGKRFRCDCECHQVWRRQQDARRQREERDRYEERED